MATSIRGIEFMNNRTLTRRRRENFFDHAAQPLIRSILIISSMPDLDYPDTGAIKRQWLNSDARLLTKNGQEIIRDNRYQVSVWYDAK